MEISEKYGEYICICLKFQRRHYKDLRWTIHFKNKNNMVKKEKENMRKKANAMSENIQRFMDGYAYELQRNLGKKRSEGLYKWMTCDHDF